jgi:hypothetical protein
MLSYLLHGHHNLDDVKAVQAQVVCEVSNTAELYRQLVRKIRISRSHGSLRSKQKRTLLASETYLKTEIFFSQALSRG